MLLFGDTTILIAEDDTLFREILERSCEAAGYTVAASVDNGRDAIIRAVRLKPHLVLLDVEMPSYSGLEVAIVLRQKLPSTPIVLITAEASPERVEDALRIGVHGIIDKKTESTARIGTVALPAVIQGRRYLSPAIVARRGGSRAPFPLPRAPEAVF